MASAALRRSFLPARRFSAVATPQAAISADSLSRVKSAIRAESDPDRLAGLFDSAAHLPAFRGDRLLYKLSIRKLSRARRPDLVERLLERQRTDPSSPKSEGFLIRLISLYADARMPDRAAAVFHAMPSPRSDRALSALLSAYLKNRQLDKLRDAFEKFPNELNVAPGLVSYNLYLKGLCLDGHVDTARKLFDEMASKGITPDIVSYNTILDGYLNRGDKTGVDEILKEISMKGLKPNVSTFNLRISALCAKGKSFEAEELLDVMVSRRVYPNRGSFNVIIYGYCKEGEVAKALKVYKRMLVEKRMDGGKGVSPNFETYIVLLRSLVEKGEFSPALEICKECLMNKWAPPFDAVKGLVDGLKKNSQVKEAKELVGKMRKAIKGDAVDAWKKVEDALAL